MVCYLLSYRVMIGFFHFPFKRPDKVMRGHKRCQKSLEHTNQVQRMTYEISLFSRKRDGARGI